jgi:hypothetical protein
LESIIFSLIYSYSLYMLYQLLQTFSAIIEWSSGRGKIVKG